MAGEAKDVLIVRQEVRCIGGVGCVAHETLSFRHRWMGIGCLSRGFDVVVALETKIWQRFLQSVRLALGGGMADVAFARGHRGVSVCFQHSALVGTVGIVAGNALVCFDAHAVVGLYKIRGIVAHHAQFRGRAHEPLGLVPFVGFMAHQAVTLRRGRVGVLFLDVFGNLYMARKAQCTTLLSRQIGSG